MRVEMSGRYRIELSAMQLIENGGWTAYAAVRSAQEEGDAESTLMPYQCVVDDAVFASENSALAAARRVAMAFVDAANATT
jgi:hypothetical protein